MEDDKLDFGDLDDFDIPQDGLGDDFSTGIDDLAELERELGLDDLNGDIDTQPLTTSSTTTAAATAIPDVPKKDLTASSSKQTTAPTFSSIERNKSVLQSSSHANESSSTSRPFVARGKQPYTNNNNNNNNNRYQQYNNSNQQPNFMNLPYSGMNQFNMMPMVGGPLPFGQGFLNMHGMMYNGNHNNNMAADPPPSRRIHVNPKFAGARPPPAQSNNQAEKEAEQRRVVEQIRSEQAERRRRQTEDQARLTQQKRPIGHNDSDQHNPASPLDSTQRSPYKRRIDAASELTRSHEVPLPSSLQSRLGRGTHEVPASVSKRDPSLMPSRPNGGNGFSIRGAAAAAAASTNTRVQQDKTGHQDHHNKSTNERPLSFRSVSSSGHITNRLGTNNQQQQQQQQTPTRGHRIDNKETILQRLGGGKITNKMAKKNDPSTDRQKPSSSSPSNNASNLTPIFANGKSSKLILTNLPSQVTESSLKSLEPKDIRLVSLDRGNKSATLLFTAIDSAVTFRRKYNRTMLSGEHILVSFAKN